MINSKNKNAVAKTLRVLVVEDDRVTARVAAAVCESLGYTVAVARDGLEALEFMREHTVDVVFMDLEMPRMGGFETAHEMRCMEDDHNFAPVPIIAVTGATNGNFYARSLQVGMDDCLHKPYTLRMVQDAIARHVAHPSARQLVPDEVMSHVAATPI